MHVVGNAIFPDVLPGSITSLKNCNALKCIHRGVCGGAPSPDLGLSAFFNSFRKLSLKPFHLAFAASSANTVNIAFTLLVNVSIAGTFQQEFLSDNFHSPCE